MALQKARACLQQRQKANGDQRRCFLEVEVGDEVPLSTEHIPFRNVGAGELLVKWMKLLKVVEKMGDVSVAYCLNESACSLQG